MSDTAEGTCFVCERRRPLAVDSAIECEGHVLDLRLQVCHRCYALVKGLRLR